MEDFEKIYAGYLKEVYHFLLKLSGDPDLAEELAQAAFASAFEHLDQFEGKCKLSVWLCQIAKYEYYAWYRNQKHFTGEEVPESYPPEGDARGTPASVASSGNPEETVLGKERQRRILEVLQGLPEPYQEVFILRAAEEASYQEISRIFGKSQSWARVTYYRAKCMMAERLGGEEDDAM